MSRSEVSQLLRAFGTLEAKVDALIEHEKTQTGVFEAIHLRLGSLETTRTQQRAYWRIISALGGVVVTLLGKMMLFPHKP